MKRIVVFYGRNKEGGVAQLERLPPATHFFHSTNSILFFIVPSLDSLNVRFVVDQSFVRHDKTYVHCSVMKNNEKTIHFIIPFPFPIEFPEIATQSRMPPKTFSSPPHPYN
jgi:hypothetical protein